MSYILFIDDTRDPVNQESIVVRNLEEAQAIITELGWPNHIDFDHDLGKNEPSGYDFAKWIIEEDMDKDFLTEEFSFSVHSMNPVGRENIKNLLNNYLAFKFLS